MWHLAQETLASINICKGLTVRRRDLVFSKAKFPFLSPVDEVVETGSHGISAAYPLVPPLHFDWLKSEMFMGPCFTSVQFSCSAVADSLWPMDCSTPGSSVLHHLPEFAQNSCPLSWWGCLTQFILCHPLLLLPSVFPSIRVFPNE